MEWKFRREDKSVSERLRPRLAVSNNDCAIEAVREGLGISRLLSYQVAPLIASGELIALLSDFQPPRLPINVIHRDGRYTSAKLRSFIDLMVARLRAEPSLDYGPRRVPDCTVD